MRGARTGGGLGRGEGFARDALFALELHGVHLRADAILAADLVNLVDATGVEEDALSQSGLATVDMRGDADVSREGVHAGGEGGKGSRDRGRERDRTPVRDGGLSQAQSARQGESFGAGTRSPRRGVEPRRGSAACGPAHRATPCGEVANPAPAAAPHHFRLAPADFPERKTGRRGELSGARDANWRRRTGAGEMGPSRYERGDTRALPVDVTTIRSLSVASFRRNAGAPTLPSKLLLPSSCRPDQTMWSLHLK